MHQGIELIIIQSSPSLFLPWLANQSHGPAQRSLERRHENASSRASGFWEEELAYQFSQQMRQQSVYICGTNSFAEDQDGTPKSCKLWPTGFRLCQACGASNRALDETSTTYSQYRRATTSKIGLSWEPRQAKPHC